MLLINALNSRKSWVLELRHKESDTTEVTWHTHSPLTRAIDDTKKWLILCCLMLNLAQSIRQVVYRSVMEDIFHRIQK